MKLKSKKIKLPRKRKKALIKLRGRGRYDVMRWSRIVNRGKNLPTPRDDRFYDYEFDETPHLTIEERYRSARIVKRY